MNSTSLHALIVDQHFGELSPEAVELLENHLAENPEARAEADRIRQTLATTERAVLQHPELIRAEPMNSPVTRHLAPRLHFNLPWLAKAAAIALLGVATTTAGYFIGKNQVATSAPPALAVADPEQRPPRKDSPWARYRVTPERSGTGTRIVRVETAKLDSSTLR